MFTLVLLTGNTTAQVVCERPPELVAFTGPRVQRPWRAGLVLAETALLMGSVGVLGMLAATALRPLPCRLVIS